MLSAETNAALVAAAAQAPKVRAAPMVTVRIVRNVMVGGFCVFAGREIEVDTYFAGQLINAGKAERVTAPGTPEHKPAAKAAKEKTRAQQ